MNRREFLTGLFGAAAVIAIPTPVLLLEAKQDWMAAMIKVHSDAYTNLILFGQCAIQPIDEFPFIRSIPFEEMANIPSKDLVIGQCKGLLP